jgi:hypothetical protein
MITIPASYSTEMSGSDFAVSAHEKRQRVKMRFNRFLGHRFKFIDDHPSIPNCIIKVTVQAVTHAVKASEVRRCNSTHSEPRHGM